MPTNRLTGLSRSPRTSFCSLALMSAGDSSNRCAALIAAEASNLVDSEVSNIGPLSKGM